jgi:hypothetical protein
MVLFLVTANGLELDVFGSMLANHVDIFISA